MPQTETNINDVIADLLGRGNKDIAETSSNFLRNRGNNSTTQNYRTQNSAINLADEVREDQIDQDPTSSPVGPSSRNSLVAQKEEVSVVRPTITGFLAQHCQKQQGGRHRFHVTVVMGDQPAKLVTVYSKPPDRRREYRQSIATDLQAQLYQESENSQWWLCNITERNRKAEVITDLVAWLEITDIITMNISDGVTKWCLQFDQQPTPAQAQHYDVCAQWGEMPRNQRRGRSIYDCSTVMGGHHE